MPAQITMSDAQQQFAADVAKLVVALQVPVSMPGFKAKMGPAAYEAWERLMVTARHGSSFGWTDRTAAAQAFRELIAGPAPAAKPARLPGEQELPL